MNRMKLYGYFRSSTSYRVRIALHLKNLAFDTVPVNLVKAEQHSAAFRTINAQGRVPALADGATILTQSLAIIEYLDDAFPDPALVWGDAAQKAQIRRLAQIIACDAHPVTNLNVLQYLSGTLGVDDAQKQEWYRHFSVTALAAFEAALPGTGPYCCGNRVSMADICLIPHLYNMRRYDIALDDYPLLRAIERHCMTLPAFQNAAPEMQPDAPADLVPIHGPQAPLLRDAA